VILLAEHVKPAVKLRPRPMTIAMDAAECPWCGAANHPPGTSGRGENTAR